MPLSTNTILDSMEWAKKFNYDRQQGIGNYLEPAKTSANLVMQTILSPPFDWWWNAQEITFTCNPVATTASATLAIINNGVLTLESTNTFAIQQLLLLSDFASIPSLNGQSIVVATNAGGTMTANINFPNHASTPDVGIITAATTQDYTVPVPFFSHIEHASLLNISATPARWVELEMKNNLSLDTSPTARPGFINPQYQDASGNVTFRLMPAPNLAYPIDIHAQNVAPLITSLNQTWAPLPDYFSYIYNWGFLALMWAFSDDPRAAQASQKFVANLLGRAEGLTETDRQIFLNNWTALTGIQQAEANQGIQARSAL